MSEDRSAPARFVRLARAFPERLAVEDERESVSYGALLDRSLSVAAALRESPAERSALLCDHDVSAIAGWLGVLLAGKTAVPLDPSDPPARRRWMLADAGAEVIVASPCNPCDVALPLVDPEAVAYILYTSGSTGTPKGVYQSHRNLLQQMLSYGRSLDLGPGDRLTLLPSYSVDAGLMDIFGALLHGASLHLWDLRRRGVEGLPAWLSRRRITLYHSTPTVFRALHADLGPEQAFPEIRRVVLGGEPARPADLALFRRHFRSPALLVNGYGPTESTLGLQAFFPPESTESEDPLPLGLPVPGVQALLLDEEGHETEDEGEIALQGESISLGYWRRPELDRASFLPDPAGGARRIYRTGDRGRRRPDGSVSFLGRRDHQIKLRGHRIEIGEIEAVLRSHPAVEEAVIVVETGPLGEPLLAAWVVTLPGRSVESTMLLSWLRDRLPAPMVPSRISLVPSLPRTASGKVDRQALRGGEAIVTTVPAARVLSATEAWLAQLFHEILGAESPGPASDFFALGGHSLLAARLLARILARRPLDLSTAAIFEHPSLGALAAHLDALGCSAPDPGVRPAPPLPLADRDAPLPLSFAQERLWFFDRLMPGCPVYHVPIALRVRGALDRMALTRALAELVRRHEALRTRVALLDDRPVQQIRSPWAPALTSISLREEPEPGRFARACALAVEHAQGPFDLAQGELLRATLFELEEGDWLLLVVVHHFAADGWAARLLLSELGDLYRAFVRGLPSPLADPPLHPADIAVWQRSVLGSEREEILLAFWKDRLLGAPPLDLPLDRPRPPIPSLRGRIHGFAIPEALAIELRALGRRAGITLHMTFLAAFALLLARHAGQDDLVIATASFGREREEVEPVVGTFVNTVLLRLRLDESSPLRSLLEQAREVTLSAQAHQDLPFERLVAALHPERAPGREPLFQAMLLVQSLPPADFTAPELRSSRIELDLGTSLCDLTLQVRDEGELQASFEYATDLFEEDTIARMTGRLLTLLGAMAAGLDRPASELPLLPESERLALFASSKGPSRIIDVDVPIHALVEAQAASCPDAPAVVFEGRTLSYRALMEAARAFSAELREQGIGRGSLVPLLARRSLDLVPRWLGTLLSGATFVPLDPRWPPLRLDAARAQIARPLLLAPGSALPDDPAYGFFTSGSTGIPKLALIPHHGIKNRFAWMDETFGPASPVTLATTAPVFDSAVWQLLWPLTRGGTAILPSDTPGLTASELLSLVERHRVTILDFVPSVLDASLDALIEPASAPRLGSVRDILLGGEAIKSRSCRLLQEALPWARIKNLYGPTEASIGCIAHTLSPGEGPEIPIGRPISNVTALLVDRRLRLAPPGVSGEIVLGGACVGLGYHGDPEGTRRSFLASPFPELGVERLYRTGDRGRRRADGSILFLGRIDEQIKIRGQRIEPREIELALLQHASVKEAAVLQRELPGGEPALVAYVAPSPLPSDLDDFLRARLPEPMVPARFVSLSALPRSAAGKVDRGALSAMPLDALPTQPGEAPRSAIERKIAAIWASVLGIASPSIDAGFFELGGHSLRMAVLAQRLERELGRAIPLIELFRRPTIRACAAWIAGEEDARDEATPAPHERAAALRRQRARRQGGA